MLFGEYNFFFLISSAWIKVEQLKPYHPHKEEMIKINKGKRFQQAVDAVEEFLRKTKGKDQVSGWFFTVCIKTRLGMNDGETDLLSDRSSLLLSSLGREGDMVFIPVSFFPPILSSSPLSLV